MERALFIIINIIAAITITIIIATLISIIATTVHAAPISSALPYAGEIEHGVLIFASWRTVGRRGV